MLNALVPTKLQVMNTLDLFGHLSATSPRHVLVSGGVVQFTFDKIQG